MVKKAVCGGQNVDRGIQATFDSDTGALPLPSEPSWQVVRR